jgi:hypothetical protein
VRLVYDRRSFASSGPPGNGELISGQTRFKDEVRLLVSDPKGVDGYWCLTPKALNRVTLGVTEDR